MRPKWLLFDPNKRRNFPPERRMVLVITAEKPDDGLPSCVAIGYLRLHTVPFFVVPGVGGTVTHFADCLGDDFRTPLLTTISNQRWQMTNGEWGQE
jgi:hypothetical protein